jgi:hypothetical protein
MKSAFNFSRSLLDQTSELPYNNHLMCFENGVIDLRTGEQHPHSPKHFLTSAIAANYVPSASCPGVFRSFIESAFGEDLLEVLQAVTSMLLDPTAHYGRFVHLIGASGSGKGTMLRLWLEMFGMENTRSISSFSELETPEGRHHNLTGVRLCVFPDVGGYMRGLKPYYELVDNGPMSGRALYSPSAYQIKWNTRFVIASVDHLQIENSGDGWDRRVIPLPTKARSGAMNLDLSTQLSEVKGEVISWALSMPRERRDWILANLSSYERIEAARADASISGDPVRYFVDLCLRPSESKQKIQNHTLHTWYEAFCSVHGYQRMSMSRFVSHLKTVLPVQHQPRRRASTTEDPECVFIPAHWNQLQALSGVFEETDSDDGSIGCRCVKSKCEEGGLVAFSEYAHLVLSHVQACSDTFKDVQAQSNDPEHIDLQGVSGHVQTCSGQNAADEKNQLYRPDWTSDKVVSLKKTSHAKGFQFCPEQPDMPEHNAETRMVEGKLCSGTEAQVPEHRLQVPEHELQVGDRVWVRDCKREGVIKDTRSRPDLIEHLVEGSGLYGGDRLSSFNCLRQVKRHDTATPRRSRHRLPILRSHRHPVRSRSSLQCQR